MKRAAIGIRMHSGWGVMVAVAQEAGLLEVLARRRIVTMDSRTAGSKQPYHHAANIGLPAAERYLANCTAASERVALAAVEDMKRELEERRYRVIGSALLFGLWPRTATASGHSRVTRFDSRCGRRVFSRSDQEGVWWSKYSSDRDSGEGSRRSGEGGVWRCDRRGAEPDRNLWEFVRGALDEGSQKCSAGGSGDFGLGDAGKRTSDSAPLRVCVKTLVLKRS